MPPPGPHPPGSFTKNWGWRGRGLLGLHEAIRKGFGGKLQPITRNEWRAACGLTAERFLIASNFFLFNVVTHGENTMAVDEFVRQAIMEPHSTAFDRLGLFVLNLSMGGRRLGSANGTEFPALWANSYVKQVLFQGGRWQSKALDESAIDALFFTRIRGNRDSRVKIRNNYRGVFEQAKFLPARQPVINTDAGAWMAAALFTAWDRRTLASGPPPKGVAAADLVSASESAEDYKLIGLSIDEFRLVALPIAEQYAAANGIVRFQGKPSPPGAPRSAGAPSRLAATGTVPEPLNSADLKWLLESGSNAAVERELSHRLAQKRNQILAAKLKALYRHECMACGGTVVIGLAPQRRYAEAAHIKPLGMPHNGPDKSGNMLVLCPNHHLQFDRGIISIEQVGAAVQFMSRISGDATHRKTIKLHSSHSLDPDCVRWHKQTFANIGR